MTDRDELIVIQAVTNSIKVDMESCRDDIHKPFNLNEMCLRLSSVIGDMQDLINDMEG